MKVFEGRALLGGEGGRVQGIVVGHSIQVAMPVPFRIVGDAVTENVLVHASTHVERIDLDEAEMVQSRGDGTLLIDQSGSSEGEGAGGGR